MGLQCERLKDGYVHHEATHAKSLNSEEINPNPNSTDKQPIYLKRPAKHPKNFFRSFNHDWKNPKELKIDIIKTTAKNKVKTIRNKTTKKRVAFRPFD